MHMSPQVSNALRDEARGTHDPGLSPPKLIFRTADLDHASEHLAAVFANNRLAYLTRERRLDFLHRQARLGALAVNSLQFGVGITVKAPPFSDFYLVQFTLAGGCRLSQGRNCIDAPAGSAVIVNPYRPFSLTVFPDTRRLMLRVDRQLVEREWRAWTGSDRT
jgi:hypothetical protein